MTKTEEKLLYEAPTMGIRELYGPDVISSSGGNDNDGDISSEGEWVPHIVRC